jgi:hypothetical protein
MVRDSLAQALELPYSIFESGPYPPPCQEERVAYSNSLGLTGSPPPDPQVPFCHDCGTELDHPVAVLPGSAFAAGLHGRQCTGSVGDYLAALAHAGTNKVVSCKCNRSRTS